MREELPTSPQKADGDPMRLNNKNVDWKRMAKHFLNSHQDHVAERGFRSVYHNGLVRTPIPIPETMKIPATRGAFDKEWDKLKKVAGVERIQSTRSSKQKYARTFRNVDGLMLLETFRVGIAFAKVCRTRRASKSQRP